MSRFAELLLLQLNPSYHVRLRALLEERKKIPSSLLSALCHGPTPDGIDDFSKKCYKLSCPALGSVRRKGWIQLRLRAASMVWDALADKECTLEARCEVASRVLKEACKSCPRCYERLSACIVKSIHDLEAQLPVKV
jgi:hypothetical protein